MEPAQPRNIEQVTFYGDQLTAVKTDDRIMVSVKQVCEAIGIDPSSQVRKLKDAKWVRYSLITIPDSRGRLQEMAMVDHESIPYWMASISARKVGPEYVTKLELYQLEAKKVLADHFLKAKPATEVLPYDPNDSMQVLLYSMFRQRQEQQALQKVQEQHAREINETRMVALEAVETVNAIHEQINNRTGYFTVAGYATNQRWSLALKPAATLGARMSAYSRHNGYEVYPVDDPRFGRVNSYCPEVLKAFHEEIMKASSRSIH
jgi:hypothetical protein